jgi:hypothetical protein
MRNIKFSRRSLLRGLGAGTVLLGGMSKTLYAQTLGRRVPRAAFFFYANGSHPDWAPTAAGENFVLTPHLAPMEAIRKDLVIMKNMRLERGSGNSHRSTSFSALGAGNMQISFDQILADFVKTPVPSLEISIGRTGGGGGRIESLSQRNGAFMNGARNPVTAYSRIAERVTAGAAPPSLNTPPMNNPMNTEKSLLVRKSLLDFIREDVNSFKARLGGGEKSKFDFYLDSLRTLERDVGGSILPPDIVPSAQCSKIPAPPAMLSTDTRVNDMPNVNKIYMDIIAMGFACGVTRVAASMWGGGQSDEPISFNGIGMGNWHSSSHGNPKGGEGQKMIKVQAFMSEQFTYFVQKLKSYADGEHSLLDNTVAVLSTQNGTSTQVQFAIMDHPKFNTPMIIAGSGGGFWKTGRVLECNDRNHNDVYLTIAHAFGMKVTSIGNPAWCKGPMPGFAA